MKRKPPRSGKNKLKTKNKLKIRKILLESSSGPSFGICAKHVAATIEHSGRNVVTVITKVGVDENRFLEDDLVCIPLGQPHHFLLFHHAIHSRADDRPRPGKTLVGSPRCPNDTPSPEGDRYHGFLDYQQDTSPALGQDAMHSTLSVIVNDASRGARSAFLRRSTHA